MKLKNVLKTLGAVAALAAVVPYSREKNEETGETTTKALLWNATTKPKDEDGKRLVELNIGPAKKCCCDEELPEEGLFDDLADCGCCDCEPQCGCTEDVCGEEPDCGCCEEAPCEEPSCPETNE